MSNKKTAVKQEEKEVVRIKTWSVIEKTFADGSKRLERTNCGFEPLELMGVCELATWEIREQIMGRIIPDQIKRTVIKAKEE